MEEELHHEGIILNSAIAAPTIATQDNFPQAFTNMRLGRFFLSNTSFSPDTEGFFESHNPDLL